jgi:hypothetical protein
MIVGRHKAIWDKTINRPTKVNIGMTYHPIARKVLYMRTSFATPYMTNTFIPTDGVTSDISSISVTMMPNHMGLNPYASINGRKLDMVSNIIAIISMRLPRIKYITEMDASARYRFNPLPIAENNSACNLVIVRK